MIIDSELTLRIAIQAETEDEHLEFKAARQSFDTDKLADYCTALANEGGGHLILGVSDEKPRQIVGTNAFRDLGELRSKLLQKLRRRVEIFEIDTVPGRVLVFRVPGVPPGHPLSHNGRFLMRVGEELVAMTGERLRTLIREDQGDLSSTVVEGLAENVLDPHLIERFRREAAAKCERTGTSASRETAQWIRSAPTPDLLEGVYLTVEPPRVCRRLQLLRR